MAEQALSPVKRALIEIKKLKLQKEALEKSQKAQGEPIAIVGMACRFPAGANSPELYWKNLHEGVDGIREVPSDRWNLEEFFDADPSVAGKMYSRWGGFLNLKGDTEDTGVKNFDAEFFGINNREAEGMDPQQRLLLEVAYEALNDAGVRNLKGEDPELGAATALYAGISTNDYAQYQLGGAPEEIDSYSFTGTAFSVALGRISYLLGINGPNFPIDTACSSSLVAIHTAAMALRNQECDMALAGGVGLILRPSLHIYFCKSGALSPRGRCHTFSQNADGYVRGEGAGFIVLKRLSTALKAGDRIYGLIRGSAVNHDGPAASLTAPNGKSQQAVIAAAVKRAGIEPSDVGYMECHGTGTPLGDPMEVNNLGKVLGKGRTEPLILGSHKTNIGHLEAAAGIAGVIKIILAFQNNEIPANFYNEEKELIEKGEFPLNPNIDLEAIPARVALENVPWTRSGKPRLAGISGFGFSGTNAHLVFQDFEPSDVSVEDYPEAEGYPAAVAAAVPEDARAEPRLLRLTGHTAEALVDQARNTAAYLRDPANPAALDDICYTAFHRRTYFTHNLLAAGRSRTEIAERLEKFVAGENVAGVAVEEMDGGLKNAKIGYVFSGQGSQWAEMGVKLMETEPVFRAKIEEIDALLKKQDGCDWSLIEELKKPEAETQLGETRIAQPAIFAVQVGLAEVLIRFGLPPAAITGHSVGEVAAAHVSGVLSLEDAVRVIFHRARIMQQATGLGKMAAVGITAEEGAEFLKGHEDKLALAVINSPNSIVYSGDEQALEAVLEKVKQAKGGVFNRVLPVNYAFHSPQMEPFKSELIEALSGLKTGDPESPAPWLDPDGKAYQVREGEELKALHRPALYSTVSGKKGEVGDGSNVYWAENMRGQVRFAQAIEAMLNDGVNVFVEVGPHNVLGVSINQCIEHARSSGGPAGPTAVLPTLRRKMDDELSLLETPAGLLAKTADSLLREVEGGRPIAPPAEGRVVSLPVYAWQSREFWVKSKTGAKPGARGPAAYVPGMTGHPFLGQKITIPGRDEIIFQAAMSIEAEPYIADHRIMGNILFPGAGFADLGLAAGRALFGEGPLQLENFSISAPLFLLEDDEAVTQVLLDQDSGEVEVHSKDGSIWVEHARGEIKPSDFTDYQHEIGAIRERCPRNIPVSEYYKTIRAVGYEYGPIFRGITEIRAGESEAIGFLELPDVSAAQAAAYSLHPALLDAALQVSLAPLYASGEGAADKAYLPLGIEKLTYEGGSSPLKMVSHVRYRDGITDREAHTVDIDLMDENGVVLGLVQGLSIKKADPASLLASTKKSTRNWFYDFDWRAAPLGSKGELPEGKLLVLQDAGGFHKALNEALTREGRETITVEPAASTDDYRKLFAESFPDGQCGGVIHLASLDLEGDDADPMAGQERAALDVMRVLRVMNEVEWKANPKVYLVTRGAQSVLQGESTVPGQAALWGLGRVAALELPDVYGGLIDLDPAGKRDKNNAKGLVAELGQASREDVALRDNKRNVARLTRRGEAPARPFAFDGEAAYLVTGGLGGLGLATAEWCAEQGAKHLVLSGRSEPKPDAQSKIKALEGAGVTVQILRGDVADSADVKRIIGDIALPLKGVIHAAGVLDDGMLVQQSTEKFRKVLAPKVAGAWNLHNATRRAKSPLDFFVMFSSISSFLGTPGQSNYAAANAFMDALAYQRRAADLPAASINWGPWGEVGMAAALEDGQLQSRGLDSIPLEQGLGILGDLLGQDFAQAVVVPINWHRLFSFLGDRAAGLIEDMRPAGGESAAAVSIAGDLEAAAAEERVEMLRDFVGQQIIAVLALDPSKEIDPGKGLFEMGMDSLGAVELTNRLQSASGKKLPKTLTFDYPNIETITDFLLNDIFELPAEAQETGPSQEELEAAAQAKRQEEMADMSADDQEAELLRQLEEAEKLMS